MKNIVVRNILRFLLLMLLQVLVLNNIYMSGYVTPLLFVLFVLMLPTGMNRLTLLVVSFGVGLCADLFCNMLGVHAACCTLLAMCRILFADRILTNNDEKVVSIPCIKATSPQTFIGYLVMMYAIYFFFYYLLELFSFREFFKLLLSIILSTVVSSLLSILYQLVCLPRAKDGSDIYASTKLSNK